MVAEVSNLVPAPDGYDKVLVEMEKYKDTTLSVPELSRLLGVKTTTINARFRREKVQVVTLGRTNYIPGAVALRLADLHKYALKGWPTLHEVSRATGIKAGTLKARCEKGKLEGYVDLTKRLRINPAEVPSLSLDHHNGVTRPEPQPVRIRPKVLKTPYSGELAPRASTPKPAKELFKVTVPARKPFTLPPAPEPHVQIITASSYGFSTHGNAAVASLAATRPKAAPPAERRRGALTYDPEKPFSISQCSVGKTIKYEQYDGTITKLINDPFNPAIKVALPNHQEPLMREILLRVGK